MLGAKWITRKRCYEPVRLRSRQYWRIALRERGVRLNFATKNFNDAVKDLQGLCGTHTQLFRLGQFYVTNRTKEELIAQIKADLSANLRLVNAPVLLANTIRFFETKLGEFPELIKAADLTNMLNLIEANGDMAAIRAMIGSTKQDEAHARADFNAVWSNTTITAAPLFSGSPATLGKMLAAFTLEKGACFDVVLAFAKKLFAKRDPVRLSPTVVLSDGTVGGALPKLTQPGVPASLGVPETLARETLVYAQPNGLSAAVARMKAALKAREFIQCGVLSGALHDHNKFPKPEHYLLVFAHDIIDSNDAFLFWDPDAARSNIAGTSWGDGFGVLFSRDGRLSTGVDDADLADIDRTKGATTEGNHLRDVLRHSYQVYSLQTLPMPAQLKLHVKVLSPPAHASVDEILDRTVEFFAANGLALIELSRETIATGTDLDRFQMLYVGADPEGDATAEITDLHATLRQPRDFGVTPAASELVIAFVDSMVPAQRGCSIHPLEQPGVIISSALATEWTLAHEIGRVLGLLSSSFPGELTFRSTEKTGEEVPPLSEDNRGALMESPLVEV